MPRVARKKSASGIYHIMLRGINKQTIFKDDEDCEKYLQVLKKCRETSGYKLLAYCLMDNHLHLLIKEEQEELRQIFKRIGVRYVHWYNSKYQRTGHLFQDRFKSEPVDDDRYFLTVLRYILQNPVQAGFCKDASEYKWSSFHDYLRGTGLTDTAFGLSLFHAAGEKAKTLFANYMQEDGQTSCLDIEQQGMRFTDTEALDIMQGLCGTKDITEFQDLDEAKREQSIALLNKSGLSIRQISKLTGASVGVVRRVLHTVHKRTVPLCSAAPMMQKSGTEVETKHRLLKREGIHRRLRRIFDYPLTVIVAAMGYGKTTSARAFLNKMEAGYVWLSVGSNETSVQYIWDLLTRQLAKTEPALGKQLNALGFPMDAQQRERILKIIEEHVYMTNTVLVIDDYHFAHSPELDKLVERIVRTNISGLHILLISRTKPEINMDELLLKGYCYLLKNDVFELSKSEIKAYFQLYGHAISPDIVSQVQKISEGWITAVYLIIQRYCAIGRLEPGRDIENLIERAIMPRYSEEERRILMSLCVLDSFTLPQAAYVMEEATAAGFLQRLSDNNSFIRYDERTESCKMHNIFSNYLQKLLHRDAGAIEEKKIYRRTGEWYIENGNVLSGLKFLLRAEEYDLILLQFEKEGITEVLDRAPQPIIELFAQIPTAVKYRHPIGYLVYAEFHLSSVDMQEGAELLAEIEAYYEKDTTLPPPLKRRIAGEVQLIRSLCCFNDLRKMHVHQLEAHRLLEGSSSVMNKDMIFTFGSPHSLYLYYREEGAMLWTLEYMDQVFFYFRETANGLGTGFEYTVRAEYCLETGNYAEAELYGYKAVYKAQTMEQMTLILCASLTLARLYTAQGKFDKARELMNDLGLRVAHCNSPILNCTFDLCSGYLAGIMQEHYHFPQWLKTGDMEHSDILYQGMAFNYIVYGKALLLEQDYIRLEALCEEMYPLFSIFNNLLGYVHAYILDAIAKYNLYGLESAREAILPALEIGGRDYILLPFAEYGPHILELLRTLAKENQGDGYIERLWAETTAYCNHLKNLEQETPSPPSLSTREREVLQLIAVGKTNKEIASMLYIAEVTVRKNITSIYRKLDIRSRAAAVKKAIALKLD